MRAGCCRPRRRSVSPMEAIYITKTQKGKIKLGHKGFLDNEMTQNATSICFRCEAYCTKKCQGKMFNNLAMLEIVQEAKSIRHNHLPNHKNIQFAKVREKIKTAARETEETTAQICHTSTVTSGSTCGF